MKKLAFVIVCLLALPAAGQPWSGSGAPNDPYQILDANDMQAIGANSVYLDAHFKLMEDIDLAAYTGTQFNIIGPDWGSEFTGVFDGNGHAIRNFSWSYGGPNYVRNVGVFGVIGTGGEIKNVRMTNADVNVGDSSDFVGSLAGFNDFGYIENCYVSGTIRGGGRVGGMFGYNWEGKIINCYSECEVLGDNSVGGLIGVYWDGQLLNCHTNSNVSGNSSIGGLVGDSLWTIEYCYAIGNVLGGSQVGGLIGYNCYGEVHDCYAKVNVSGNNGVGGLVGWNYGGSATVINCYSTGKVDGISDVGGLVGAQKWGATVVTDSFWDVNTSGEPNSDGGTGLTTDEMQDANTYIDAGWDFNTPIWKFCSVPDYPRLWWEECPVLEPTELIAELLEGVGGLELPSGIENSLEAKLEAALGALEDDNENNDAAAINTLGAFINAVEAQCGKKIPEAEADALIAAAQEIIELLSNG